MINKEEKNEKEQKKIELKINIMEIPSFEFLFNLFKSEKYKIHKFSNDLQKFCKESENYEYICENNKEYKIPKEINTLFKKFILCRNRFDFQITMSDLLIQFFLFIKNIKLDNKKEYNFIKQFFQIFTDIKSDNLLMDDIQCLIEYGLLKNYNNNFFLFLFDINEQNVKQLLLYFDIKKYFLSNINNVNSFIFLLNELINKSNDEIKPILLIKKLDIYLTEILDVLKIENQEKNSEYSEIKHKIENIREKIKNLINKDKIFEKLFNDETFISHLDIVLNLFKKFPNEIDKQINILILKNNRQNIKVIYKFLIKHASLFDNYI